MARCMELWPIDRLIPYARNARTHSDAQIAQIAASIREFGFNSPILVDSHAGIIAGHARLLAARKLQLREVPVVVLDHLSQTDLPESSDSSVGFSFCGGYRGQDMDRLSAAQASKL